MRLRASLCLAGVGVFVCVAAAFAARTNRSSGSIPIAAVNSGAQDPKPIAQPTIASKRTSPDGIRPNLFGDPIPSAAPKPVRQAVKQIAPIVAAEVVIPPDPLANYVVTGILHNDDGAVALLEDRKTKEGRFVHVGEKVEGLEITGIDSQGVHFGESNAPRLLAMNDKYDLTPLDRDAGYLGGRMTKHDGENPGPPVTLARDGQLLLTNKLAAFSTARFGKTENFDKLNDKAFEGKIPLNEYHQRVNAASPPTYQIITLDTLNTVHTNATGTTDSVVFKLNTTLDSK